MKRLNYSNLTGTLRRIHAAAEHSENTSVPVKEILEKDRELRICLNNEKVEIEERRQFLKSTLGVGTLLGLGTFPRFSHAAGNPQNGTRVAIIGAGAGGMRTAHRLYTKYGWTSTVYEASERIGGRMYSNTGYFSDGRVVEHGGEFLSSEHSSIINLVDALDLELEDVSELSVGDQETYWIGGQLYSEDDLQDEWVDGLFQTFRQARKAAPWQPMYNTAHTPEHLLYDQMTASEWLDSVGYSSSHWMHKLLITDVVAEYGMLGPDLANDTNSALNLIYLLGFSNCGSGGMPLAGTDERYHVVGGNQRVIDAMYDELPAATVETGRKLQSISGRRRGPYTLSFDNGPNVVCDKLVMSLPLGLINEIDIDTRITKKFSPEKNMAIAQASTSDNGKVQMEFSERFWATTGQIIGSHIVDQAARSYSDPDKFISTWEGEPGNSSTKGLLVDYNGGPEARQIGGTDFFGEADPADVNRLIGYFQQVWPSVPDIASLYTGKSLVSNWFDYPLAGGAFTSPSINTMTVWWGAQWETEKNIHFAGEAYDEEGWSYMDGAIRSGKRVAKEIAKG